MGRCVRSVRPRPAGGADYEGARRQTAHLPSFVAQPRSDDGHPGAHVDVQSADGIGSRVASRFVRPFAVSPTAVLYDFKRQDCTLVHLPPLVAQSNRLPMGVAGPQVTACATT